MKAPLMIIVFAEGLGKISIFIVSNDATDVVPQYAHVAEMSFLYKSNDTKG